jgi:hypothetical protein
MVSDKEASALTALASPHHRSRWAWAAVPRCRYQTNLIAWQHSTIKHQHRRSVTVLPYRNRQRRYRLERGILLHGDVMLALSA